MNNNPLKSSIGGPLCAATRTPPSLPFTNNSTKAL